MLSSISLPQLAIILVIVVLIFGTKKLRNMGGDLGGAVRSFKKAMNEDGAASTDKAEETNSSLEHQSQAHKDADFSAKEREKN